MADTLLTSPNIGPVSGSPVTVTASDVTVYDPPLRGLYVGVTGNLAVTFKDGASVTYVGIAAGVVHPIDMVSKVLATGTTATSILGHRS